MATIVDSTGQVNIPLSSAISPIRGYLTISRDSEILLYNGNLSIQVGTASNPSRISGSIGCAKTCAKPAKIPQGDMCQVSGDSIVLYEDSIATGWSSWSWGQFSTTANFSWKADFHCGNSSIEGAWDNYTGLALHNDLYAKINITAFPFLEFFMKFEGGPSQPFYVSFNLGETGILVQAADIVNYMVESSWTRVRVPLSRYTFFGPITRVAIYSYYTTPNMRVSFDTIRFVTANAVDTMVDSVSTEAAAYTAPINTCQSYATTTGSYGSTTSENSGSTGGIPSGEITEGVASAAVVVAPCLMLFVAVLLAMF